MPARASVCVCRALAVIAAGRTIRVLSVVDTYTRECLALEVDTGFASRRVTRVLEELIARRGTPEAIRCDNGPELTSRHFLAWAVEWKIDLCHIQPGKPIQNAHVESIEHGRLLGGIKLVNTSN
jgi:putative transposase